MQPHHVILEARALSKVYEGGFSLGPNSMSLAAGETLAIVGANGAGKSTLFSLLTGNSDPSGGEISLAGQKLTPEAFLLKRQIGYLPQHLQLPRWVTGLEVLRYAASLYQIPAPETHIAAAMGYWDCASYSKRPLAACSHGMQKRVALALATLHAPPCLILDEPFSGLDLFHTRALEDEIRRRADAGQSTILSSHIAPYVAKLCHRVLIIKQGRITPLVDWSSLPFLERVAAIEACFFAPPPPGQHLPGQADT